MVSIKLVIIKHVNMVDDYNDDVDVGELSGFLPDLVTMPATHVGSWISET